MTRKGFVDLQVNGYLGVDFSSPALSHDDVRRATRALVQAGTIGYCATLITSEIDTYRRNLPLLALAMEEPGIRGRLLGIHLEGPYLSPVEGARGAHRADWMRLPRVDEFDRFQEWAEGKIKLLTLAPELEGALELCRHVKRNYDTLISLGHHLASSERIARAVDAGASLVTHLGNGCPSLLPRHDNVIISQLANESLTVGLIADGHHLPPDFIRLAWKCKGPDRTFIVSDQAPIAGFSPGIYESLGNQVELNPAGRISTLNTPYLAGSGCTLRQCMRHLRSLCFMSEEEIWTAGLVTPLRLLGLRPEEVETAELDDFRWTEAKGTS